MPKPEVAFEFAGHRLADRHRAERFGQPVDLTARELDAIELAIESRKRSAAFAGTKGPPVARAGNGRCDLAEVEAEIGKDAAHALRALAS